MERREYRLLAGLLALAIALVAAAVFLVAARVVDPAQVSLGLAGPEAWFGDIEASSWPARVAIAAGGAVVGLLAMALALRALGGRRRGAMAMHVLDSDDRGFVVVDSRGIAIIAEEAANSVQGVVAAEVDVVPRSARVVKLRVDLDVYPGANVKQAGNEARDRARQAVEELVGVEVGAVSATTHVLEPDEMARALL